MYPFRRQRPAPPVYIHGSFGPYDKRELEAARSQLIRDVYSQMPNCGGILTRVKMKCGIFADNNGGFTGCEPLPNTGVSFQSQSCAILSEEGIPWLKPDPAFSQHDECEKNGYSHQGRSRSRSEESCQDRGSESCDFTKVKEEVPSSSSSVESHRRPSNKRKLEEEEEEEEGIFVSDDDEDMNQPSTSKGDVKKLMDNIIEEGLIVSDNEDENISNLTSQNMKTCFKCDICDYSTTRGHSISCHLRDNNHYSASRYKGVMEGDILVPTYLMKVMDVQHKPAQFSSSIPLCPICYEGFNNIHSCYTHYQFVHKSKEPLYALGEVIDTRVVAMSLQPKCNKCNKIFNKFSELNSHVKSAKHDLFPPPKPNETALMICTLCVYPELFPNFHTIQNHLAMCHSDVGKMPTLKVLYVKKPKMSNLMLPKIGSKKEHAEDYLHALKRLRDETRSDKTGLKQRIKELNVIIFSKKQNKRSRK